MKKRCLLEIKTKLQKTKTKYKMKRFGGKSNFQKSE